MKKAITWLILISLFVTYNAPITKVYADDLEEVTPEPFSSSELAPPTNINELDYVPPYEKKNQSTYKKFMDYVHGTRQFKKNRGIKDPHYPKKILIHPTLLPLPDNLELEGMEDVLEDGMLNLEEISQEMLLGLTPENRTVLIRHLSNQSVHIRHDCKGKWHAHPIKYLFHEKTNAAVALALRMGALGEQKGFVTILCESPTELIPKFKGRAAPLLDKEVMANTLVCLMARVNKQNLVPISQYSTDLIQVYIKYWAGKDAERFDQCLRDLIHRINELEGNMNNFTPQQFGVLLGSLLAGSLWVCSKLKSADEKRQWMVNSIVALVRESTFFLLIAPWFAGNVAAAAAGGISLGVEGIAVAYNYYRVPRDYSAIVRRVQGHIKLSALQSAGTSLENRVRVHDMLEYMDAVINVNGEPA